MSNEFVPDIVLAADHMLGPYIKIYLDGMELSMCYEARVQWASFNGPAFGEVVINSTRDARDTYLPAIGEMPRLGEFERQGVMVRFACGKVQVILDENGKELFERYKSALAAYDLERRNSRLGNCGSIYRIGSPRSAASEDSRSPARANSNERMALSRVRRGQ